MRERASHDRGLILAFGAAKLLVHVATYRGYGIFRDELYYLACADHPALGYVDHPALSIALLWLGKHVLGDSLFAIRLLAALAGAATVVVTGLLARELGGGRRGIALACTAALICPELLGINHTFSMNSFDILFWALASFLVARIVTRPSPHLWVALGCVLGLGLANKISVLWFGLGLAFALVLTPLRRSLTTPWPWVAAGIALLFFAPYVFWEMANGAPTREFMKNAREQKMAHVTPAAFLLGQVLSMHPFTLPLWIAGILDLFVSREGRKFRALGIVWTTVFLLLAFSGTSRTSYFAAAYAIAFAAGGVALERLTSGRSRAWIVPAYVALLFVGGALTAPFALPLLSPERFAAYQRALGQKPESAEKKEMGALPQHFADMFGWPEMAAAVAGVHAKLTPAERASSAVFVGNYGEAGAIDRFGPALGLPRAISGHNNYWLWGPGPPGKNVVVIVGGTKERIGRLCASVEEAARFRHPYVMPYENDLPIHVCRGPLRPLAQLWPELKHYE